MNLFITLLLNVGVLLIIAGILTNIKFVRHLLLNKDNSIHNKILLGIMFGIMSIISTYLGLGVEGAIVNTRVIGVLASGILGGPVVGIITSVIAGAHRFLFDIGGFTSVACAISTIFEGFLGAMAYIYFQKKNTTPLFVGILAIIAEICQMLIILIIAKPFSDALDLVKIIALPMIAINSFGSIMFFSTFNRIFTDRESDISHSQSIALDIAEKSLPHLRNGLGNENSMKNVVSIISNTMPELRAIITNKRSVVADSAQNSSNDYIMPIAKASIESDKTIVKTNFDDNANDSPLLKGQYAIAAPLKINNESVGALIILTKKQWLTIDANTSFVTGLAHLFSTTLELSKISYEVEMRRKAEFRALQSQINPHFLYNALNTLSAICREDAQRTRELLLVLGDYFRHTLEINKEYIPLNDEIQAVKDYLQLEFARFEDKLNVTWNIDQMSFCQVPPLILQPIVENAVKHGADSNGIRNITITVVKTHNSTLFTVSDKGNGFSQEDLPNLLNDESKFSGIYNVHRRLLSIYENNKGLQLKNTHPGASVSFEIPFIKLEVLNENSSN